MRHYNNCIKMCLYCSKYSLLFMKYMLYFLRPLILTQVEFKVFIQQIPDLHQSFSLAFFYTFCFRFYRFNKLQGCGAVCVFNLRFIEFWVRGNVSPGPELSRWHSYGHVSFPFLSLFFDILHFMAELLVLLTPEPNPNCFAPSSCF